MPNLKDLKELMTKANSEYKNSKEKNEKHYAFYTVMNIYAIASLSVFIMPKDILERDEILLKFTEFMAGYFPNISVFSEASSLPQVVAFYTALMWIMGILLAISFCIIIVNNFIIKRDNNYRKYNSNFIIDLVICAVIISVSYDYYTGKIVNGISFIRNTYYIDMSSRFEMFVFIGFMQMMIYFIIYIAICIIIFDLHILLKNKRS